MMTNQEGKTELSQKTRVAEDCTEEMEKSKSLASEEMTGSEPEVKVDSGLMNRPAELPVGSSTDKDSAPTQEDSAVDLDSTGDSDRLVIAEDVTSPVRDPEPTSSNVESVSDLSRQKEDSGEECTGGKRESEETSSETSQDTDSEILPQDSSKTVGSEPENKSDAEPKARRRRKPVRVQKHEVSEEVSYGEKFDQNFNSLEAEPKPKTPGGPPETTLVNSFVAQAMKLWYDEELPKSLASPSKELGKFMNDAKQRGVTVTKDMISQLAEATDDSKNKENIADPFNVKMNTTKAIETIKKEFSSEMVRSGVAPDDQYYSTPSPTVPCGTDYWTPNKSAPGSQAGNSPMGTPMLAKAMQSLRAPSPAVSPSLGSDQESPANGQKLYFCTPCNKSFTFRTNLTRHQRTFHGRPCRRRTRDSLAKDDSDRRSEHSLSSEDADHVLEKRDFVEEKITPKLEVINDIDSKYGRFSPSVVSEAKVGRYSPSMPSLGASDSTPHKNILPPYLSDISKEQDYVVVTPKEKVSCSLCLCSFTSPSQLAKHEPTCRGIDRSKSYSDTSGAIDLSKPKTAKPQQEQVTSDANKSYKPKFHYTMADILNTGITSGLESPLATPFLPHPAALHSMTAMMSQHPGAFLPAHLEHSFPMTGMSGPLPAHLTAEGSSGRKPYKCSFCTKKYSSYKSLAKHASYVHKINLPTVQQPETDSMSSMVAMATAEMKMLSEQDGVPLNLTGEAMGRFPCKLCGQVFSLSSHLRCHIHNAHLGLKDSGSRSDSSSPDIAKSNGKPSEWVCNLCSQNFASKRNLYRHLNHVHKVDPKKDAQTQHQEGNLEARTSQASPSIPAALQAMPPVVSQPSLPPNLSSGVLPTRTFSQQRGTPPPSHLPLLYPEGDQTEDLSRGSVHHLQDVVERVLSTEEAGRRSKSQTPVPAPPRESSHSLKLPPKKAIMEEYKQEQEKRTMEERQKSISPVPAPQESAVLNLSQSGKVHENTNNINNNNSSLRAAHADQAVKEMSVMDLSSSKERSILSGSDKVINIVPEQKQDKSSSNNDDRKEYYPNPFSAILNLSQTYLRKLLNETPVPPPPPHSEAYSFATIKDKENSIDKDGYNRMPYSRMGIPVGREYPADTTSKLREMLTNKGLSLNKGDSDSRSNSRPSSGCASPVDNALFYDRRPLMLSSENQHDHEYNLGVSEISPLRMNTANMMSLKQKLMDVNAGGGENMEWKSKSQKKRKTVDMIGTDLKESRQADMTEPMKKKFKGTENDNSGGLDLSGGSTQEQATYPPGVDSIKTGEFPAIAIGKRHICGLCGASFTFQTNLTRHQRKLHGKPFVRKSSVGQKLEGLGPKEESMPLTLVPTPPPNSLTVVKQEAQ